MLDEPIHLNAYQDDWPDAFQVEHARIAESLGIAASAIQHIGSTAIPGMSAKPIIDIMIGVPEVPPSSFLVSALGALGYEAMGEAGIPGRWYFRLRTVPFRNAHIVETGGSHWTRNLAFRDYLRRSPTASRRYEAAKQAAFAAGAVTLVAYSRAKQPILDELLSEALLPDADRRT